MNQAIQITRLTATTVEQCSLGNHVAPAVIRFTAPIRLSLGASVPSVFPRIALDIGKRDMSLCLCSDCANTFLTLLKQQEKLTP